MRWLSYLPAQGQPQGHVRAHVRGRPGLRPGSGRANPHPGQGFSPHVRAVRGISYISRERQRGEGEGYTKKSTIGGNPDAPDAGR